MIFIKKIGAVGIALDTGCSGTANGLCGGGEHPPVGTNVRFNAYKVLVGSGKRAAKENENKAEHLRV